MQKAKAYWNNLADLFISDFCNVNYQNCCSWQHYILLLHQYQYSVCEDENRDDRRCEYEHAHILVCVCARGWREWEKAWVIPCFGSPRTWWCSHSSGLDTHIHTHTHIVDMSSLPWCRNACSWLWWCERVEEEEGKLQPWRYHTTDTHTHC